ncbi:hypothetical protein PAPYR_1131 [Paratrimastix pyriformis]|uniref:Uncharacterized protein n=1 Tax=Paratrimastix pyriformis TaxID=342808 RepID=A0ABQ8UYL6_9EUKA|nr:hypothetical protein PAPYR_1131 [Paratrimastix pyriformis]
MTFFEKKKQGKLSHKEKGAQTGQTRSKQLNAKQREPWTSKDINKLDWPEGEFEMKRSILPLVLDNFAAKAMSTREDIRGFRVFMSGYEFLRSDIEKIFFRCGRINQIICIRDFAYVVCANLIGSLMPAQDFDRESDAREAVRRNQGLVFRFVPRSTSSSPICFHSSGKNILVTVLKAQAPYAQAPYAQAPYAQAPYARTEMHSSA